MKSFAHMSMGPLKELLGKSLHLLGDKAIFSAKYNQLFTTHKVKLEKAISDFNLHKHGKLSPDKFDAHGHLLMIANVCKSAMKGKYFGFIDCMEQVRFKKSSYTGSFKIAHDVQPFINRLNYSGSILYRKDEALIYNSCDSRCLNLYPFLIWFNTKDANSPFSCVWYDKRGENETILKPCDSKTQRKASEESQDLLDIFDELVSTGLPDYSEIEDMSLEEIEMR